MGAEDAPERAVGSLGDQVDVHVADGGEEAVRVVLLPGAAAGELEAEAVPEREGPALEYRGEHSALSQRGHREGSPVLQQALGGDRVGMQGADHHTAVHGMGAEHVVRVRVGARGELGQLGRVRGRGVAGGRPLHVEAPAIRAPSGSARRSSAWSGIPTQSGRLLSS